MKKIENNLWLVDSVVAHDELTKLRDKRTPQVGFRKGIVKLGRICGYELMEILDKEQIDIETPFTKFKGISIQDKERIIIINILRAAFPFVEGLLKAFPHAKQGVISAKRREKDGMKGGFFDIDINYVKFPPITDKDVLVVADPMLATGSTILSIMKYIIEENCKPKKLILLSVVSTRVGIDKIRRAYPDAAIVTVSIDPELNDDGYIVPGLGDAGDRAFGSV
ncbi:uracil phosphoribosyltransferase [Methanosarcinales archaeon ex4572_44]|nr:MAG: uracil phosphoribosyltransferase [Methanosarcinales archaeon ex4484_138]PHP46110.1 MAG: uracil phosphoribosyltransferase [Methanosarcinales archaeon ex4572_44]